MYSLHKALHQKTLNENRLKKSKKLIPNEILAESARQRFSEFSRSLSNEQKNSNK